MLKLHLEGAACYQPLKFDLQIEQEGKVHKISDSVYKIVQNGYKNYDPVFYVETAFGGGLHVTSPQKFELLIAQEGMVYKIWDSVYKIVQNKYKIMIFFSFSKSVLGGPVTCT